MEIQRRKITIFIIATVYIIFIFWILTFNKVSCRSVFTSEELLQENYEKIIQQSQVSIEKEPSFMQPKNLTPSDSPITEVRCKNPLNLNLTDLALRYPELKERINTTDSKCAFQSMI